MIIHVSHCKHHQNNGTSYCVKWWIAHCSGSMFFSKSIDKLIMLDDFKDSRRLLLKIARGLTDSELREAEAIDVTIDIVLMLNLVNVSGVSILRR